MQLGYFAVPADDAILTSEKVTNLNMWDISWSLPSYWMVADWMLLYQEAGWWNKLEKNYWQDKRARCRDEKIGHSEW